MLTVVLLAFGTFATLLGVAAVRLEWRASGNRRRLFEAEAQLDAAFRQAASGRTNAARRNSGKKGDAFLFEELAIAGGGTAKSVVEMYDAAENHEAFLSALQTRLPGRFDRNTSPIEWTAQLLSYGKPGSPRFKGLASNWVGQLAEEDSVAYLNSLPELQQQGVHAELFGSRTHPGHDIRLVAEDGTVVDEIQCKSYGDADGFLQQIREYQERGEEVNHYIVNTEVYEQLESSGRLAQLTEQGITIDRGPWAHQEYLQQVGDTTDAFQDAADIAENADDLDGLRWVGTGIRTAQRVERLAQGKTTVHEAGVDTAADAAGTVARGASAIAAGKAGAALGTAICPGIGTIVGGLGGAIGGAILGAHVPGIIKAIVDRWKYARIREVLDEAKTSARK